MNVSVYQAAAAMNANARWQEAISENLASINIPGFKKQDLTFSAIEAGVMSQANLDPNVRFSLPRFEQSTNFLQGELKPTGVPTDVAIEGRGFFQVQLPTGATAYSRDGEFRFNASGQLVTKQGYVVLGDAGPIQVDPALGGQVTIAPSGEVTQGTEVRGKLKVVDFANPNELTQIGGGMFTADKPGLASVEVPNTTLRQGFLEASNVSSVHEMVGLVGIMRSFEANQRVMQMHSERMGRTISELGNPN